MLPSLIYAQSICDSLLVSKKIIENEYSCHELEGEESLDKLTDYMNKIKSDNLSNLSNQFKKKLREIALKETLLKRQEYLGLSYNLPSLSKDLLQCGKSHSYSNQDKRSFMEDMLSSWEYAPQMGVAIMNAQNIFQESKLNRLKRNDIITLEYMNVLKANILFEDNKNFEALNLQADHKYTRSLRECNEIKSKCRKGRSSPSSKYSCTKLNMCFNDALSLKENTKNDLLEKRKSLLKMVATSPMLFNNTDEGDILSALKSNHLRPSETMKTYLKNISPEIMRAYNNAKNLDSFTDDYLDEIKKNLSSIYNDQDFHKEFDKELVNELERLDQAALALCQGKGEDLHHYDDLVAKTLASMFEAGKKRGESELNLAMGQSAYCHLMNTKPPGEDKMSGVEIGAFALLGIGFALQVIPVVGNISGAGLIATGMAISGGTILTGYTVKDIYTQNKKLNSEIALHSTGLHGYEQLLKTRDERNSLIRWGAADIALVGADLKLLSKLKRVGSSRRYDTDRRRSLDDLEAKHGGEGQTKNVMNKYFPGNKYNISKADQIYINSLSKMIEDDILKTLKSKSENALKGSEDLRAQVEKETKDVLESIVRKCNR